MPEYGARNNKLGNRLIGRALENRPSFITYTMNYLMLDSSAKSWNYRSRTLQLEAMLLLVDSGAQARGTINHSSSTNLSSETQKK